MHLDNWLFFVLVAVAMLFRWLASAANKTRDNSDTQEKPASRTRPTPPARRAPESDQDKIRKFLEALGQPVDRPPPPRVVPRTDIPPRPVAHVEPPRGMIPTIPRTPKKAPELPKRIQLPEEFAEPTYGPETIEPKTVEKPAVEVAVSTPPPLPAPVVTGSPFSGATATAAQTDADFTALLRSSAGLRNAIILREIFGPPRSLQPLEGVGSA